MIRKKMTTPQSDLSSLELAVMSVIWNLGECASREVIDAYNARAGRRLADTTIRTVMANLRRKGYLKPVPAVAILKIEPTPSICPAWPNLVVP